MTRGSTPIDYYKIVLFNVAMAPGCRFIHRARLSPSLARLIYDELLITRSLPLLHDDIVSRNTFLRNIYRNS
ncbi:MAG: hypothetical protein KBT36_11570, partial [Kurthia sp.]|nr:hypothetical protein [Candidatus Kurthia equi]